MMTQHKMTTQQKTFFSALSILACALAMSLPQAGLAGEIEFNRDIRPILSENCFFCHGPDRKHRKGGVQLNVREAALAPTKDGARPIVPGDPDASALIKRILTDDPELQMPPPDSIYALDDNEKAILRQWIEEGAEYQAHWAYVPPKRTTEAPAERMIDQLVDAELRKRGVKPSAPADPRTLIRRVHLDLTGLPPKPETVAAFAADPSDKRYAAVVDELLASPHFGERMAVKWLDLVRYADTQGYHSDDERFATPYRDYVIDAFNTNKPFDRFTIEQLAGDLLPNPTEMQQVASGYNRLNQVTGEGGAQAEEYLIKYRADRVRNATTVWLGSSMGCAECHDHKYDPLSIEDFYRFAAFFADVEEPGLVSGSSRGNGVYPPTIRVTSPQTRKKIDKLRARVHELETSGGEDQAEIAAWTTAMRKQLKAGDLWLTVRPESVVSLNGSNMQILPDNSVKSTGTNPARDDYVVRFPLPPGSYTGIRLEAMPDPEFNNRLARGNGNYVLTEFEVTTSEREDLKPEPVKIADAKADITQGTWKIEGVIDGNPATGWAGNGHKEAGKTRTATFRFAEPVTLEEGHSFEVRMLHQTNHPNHNIGRFRLAVTRSPKPHEPRPDLNLETSQILAKPEASWTDEDRDLVADSFSSQAVSDERAAAIAKLRKEIAALGGDGQIALVTRSMAKPREVRVLPRGNWMDKSGEVVSPDVPEIFGSVRSGDDRASRLDLAKWIVSRDNPLTARVQANRLWELFFGAAISKVSDDLGSQGEWPTHPELLDALAVEFMESGWDVKGLIRLIVTSDTYRRSSNGRPDLRETDPNNRLLARQQPLRLDAEFVRDLALSVSGLLTADIGGDSVRPYQPDGYWSDSYKRVGVPHVYVQDHGDALYRRGLYTFWKRTYLHPSMLAFDAPTREECTASRDRSNTPLQALALLNDVTYVEAARALAARAIREGGASPEQRIDWLYQTVLSRPPNPEESQILQTLYAQQFKRYRTAPEDAKMLISAGESPTAKDLPPAELAAWASISRTVINLHETIVRF